MTKHVVYLLSYIISSCRIRKKQQQPFNPQGWTIFPLPGRFFFHTKQKQQKYKHKFKATQNKKKRGLVLNAAFENSSAISWRSVLMVGETRGSGENHRPDAKH